MVRLNALRWQKNEDWFPWRGLNPSPLAGEFGRFDGALAAELAQGPGAGMIAIFPNITYIRKGCYSLDHGHADK
jgi:hypothetical protein